MRKVNLILFSILCLFIFTFKVDAVCNDKALNEWATNATIEYMEDVDIRDPEDNLIHSKEYLYLLFISTQNEKGKIMVKDSEDENEYEIKYDDEIFYGYVVGSYLHMNEKTYTFTLYDNVGNSRILTENINNIVGHKKENIKKLKDLYDVDTKIIQSKEIKPGKFEIEILKTYTDFLDE